MKTEGKYSRQSIGELEESAEELAIILRGVQRDLQIEEAQYKDNILRYKKLQELREDVGETRSMRDNIEQLRLLMDRT